MPGSCAFSERSGLTLRPRRLTLGAPHALGCPHDELFAELEAEGFSIGPGALGENVTTVGVDLLGLPTGTTLRIGAEALLVLTGLRNPCGQIEAFREGLLASVAHRTASGHLVRKAGVMAVVVQGGLIRPADPICIGLPPPPHAPLERV